MHSSSCTHYALSGIPLQAGVCTNRPFQERVVVLFNLAMEIFDIRRRRLAKIIDDDFGGNQSAFGRHTGYSQSQINKWLSETNVSKRNITEISAREIEQKCLKPRDWLDSDNPLPLLSPQALKLAEIISSLPAVQQEWIVNLVESALEMKRQSQGIDRSASTDDHQEK